MPGFDHKKGLQLNSKKMEAKSYIKKSLQWGQSQWSNSAKKFQVILDAMDTRSDVVHSLQQLDSRQLHELRNVVDQYFQRRDRDPLGYYLASNAIKDQSLV